MMSNLPEFGDELRLSLAGKASIDQYHARDEEMEPRMDQVAGAEACSNHACGVAERWGLDKTPSFAKPVLTGSQMWGAGTVLTDVLASG